jgi:dTDP-4-amino-4,6-dideoxygalactose transaminase
VGADVAQISAICEDRGLLLIEDAAHCIQAWRDGRPLGSFGAMSTFSFHETKNVQCGEGGALVVNDERLIDRAEIIQEKGTDRRRFIRGQVDKYTWVDLGSSFLMSDIAAAFLWAQMLASETITERRLALWNTYDEALKPLADAGLMRLPTIPGGCVHNAHIYALRLGDKSERDEFITKLASRGITSVFHYVPLHLSPAGASRGRVSGSLDITESEADKLVRLPLFADLGAGIDRVIAATSSAVGELHRYAI